MVILVAVAFIMQSSGNVNSQLPPSPTSGSDTTLARVLRNSSSVIYYLKWSDGRQLPTIESIQADCMSPAEDMSNDRIVGLQLKLGKSTLSTLSRLVEILPKCTGIKFVGVSHEGQYKTIVPSILRCHGLIHLSVPFCELEDDDLASIGQLEQLEFIDLWANKLTDATVARLAQMPSLRIVYLTRTNISNRGVALLVRLKYIENLNLQGCMGIDDDVVIPLSAMPGLKVLSLDLTSLKCTQLSKLASNSKLRELSLGGTVINDEGLASALRLLQLESLIVSSDIMTDSAFAKIENGSNLRSIDIRLGDKCTDAGVAKLSFLKKLKTINITGGNISGEFIRGVDGMTFDLEDISIASKKAQGHSLQAIGTQRHLKSLAINAKAMLPGHIGHLSGCEQLSNLNLYASDCDDACLSGIPKLKSVNTVDVSYTRVTVNGVAGLLLKMRWLRCLNAIEMPDISREASARLHSSYPLVKLQVEDPSR